MALFYKKKKRFMLCKYFGRLKILDGFIFGHFLVRN